ncbi:MAG: hypothetical protein QXK37_04495 [Candidatus Woesearchaeota archaeon]
MNLGQKALSLLYPELYPEKEQFEIHIKYSARFDEYNANVKYSLANKKMLFHLSKSWQNVSEEIQIGLLQSLIVKAMKKPKKSTYIDLYEIFMKKIHIAAQRKFKEPELLESFQRVNAKYFSGYLICPNLKWGQFSVRKLGSYSFGSDTITISRILKGKKELLDYVMYHELLHKKLKYKSGNLRNKHHNREFKRLEAQYENSEKIESLLRHLRKINKKTDNRIIAKLILSSFLIFEAF